MEQGTLKTEIQKDKDKINTIIEPLMMEFFKKHGVEFSYQISPIIKETRHSRMIVGFNSSIDLKI